jgi:maltose alpha-D-glucosyltransferase/alpha-amylase
VANLARTVQPVEIPLGQFAGLTPVELMGQTEFPKITDHPYFLTVAPYGFYSFQLQEAVTPVTARTIPVADDHSALPALFAGVVWDSILDGSMRTIIERQALVPFLQRQRWFGGKAHPLASARFLDWMTLRRGAHPAFLTIVEAEYRDGTHERYVLPLAMSSAGDAAAIEQQHHGTVLARITGARKGLLYDGLFDDGTCGLLLAAIQEQRELAMRHGVLQASTLDLTAVAADTLTNVTRSTPDQSNTSVIFGWRLIMKLFRRLEAGPNPDVEIGEFLATRRSAHVPPLVGSIAYTRGADEPASIAMLQGFVRNQGNGWQVTIEELGRYFERVTALPGPRLAREGAHDWAMSRREAPPADVEEAIRAYLATAGILGRRTGELHVQLADAQPHEEAFTPEAYGPDEVRADAEAMRRHVDLQLALLDASLDRLDDRRRDLARQVLGHRDHLLQQIDELRRIRNAAQRIRCHGDYHLGQVLVTEGDVVILDFEGEPARPLAERRAKCSPLRDVAGMLRSFSYAALTGLNAATLTRPEDIERLAPWAELWETWASAAFLRAYLSATRGAAFIPSREDDFDAILQAFVVDKALYELGYELNNRPDWVHIPLGGVLRLGSRQYAVGSRQ